MALQKGNKASQQRQRWRDEFWPEEEAWTGETDVGWFRAPRTLALVMHLIRSKSLRLGHVPIYADFSVTTLASASGFCKSPFHHADPRQYLIT